VRRLSAHALLLAAAALGAGACQRKDRAQPSAPADCTAVAEVLTTFEVGNAATPDQRAPAVAKHRAACEETRVTSEEATCLRAAKDTWAARACLPRMFPQAAQTGATAGCAVVVTRMREAVMAEVGSAGSAAADAVAKMMPVIQQSCEQDQWPAAILDCINRSKPGDMTAFQACSNQLPKDMQDKLTQRLTAQQQQQ
jgi:hypothetical protein